MTFLPVVERELRVAARRPQTWRVRAWAVGATCALAFFALMIGSSKRMPGAGRFMFQMLAYPAFGLCLLAGVVTTADCISSERRDGTLGLLFLTDLKGIDVILGKLAAVSLNSIYCLFAILPIMALSMVLGGVTAGEFWRIALALLTALFLSIAVGIWISCWSTHENVATSATFVVVAILAIAPIWLPEGRLSLASPAYAFQKAFASRSLVTTDMFWHSIFCLWMISGGLLAWSSHRAPRCWREGGQLQWFRRRPQLYAHSRRHPKVMDTDPARWIAARHLERPIALYGAAVVAGVLPFILSRTNDRDWIMVYLISCGGLNFIVKAMVAGQVCHCLTEARRNDALAMLLATPLTVPQIITGHASAIRRHLRLPILFLIGVEVPGLIFAITKPVGTAVDINEKFLFCIVALLYVLLFFSEVSAIIWTGMWLGLTAKNETTATAKTIFRILLLPFTSLMFCWFGIPLFFVWPLCWRDNARRNLLGRFREIVVSGPIQGPRTN